MRVSSLRSKKLGQNLITVNRMPVKHVNTVFSKVPIDQLKGRNRIDDDRFEKKLYESIKDKGILDPLLVWFLTGVPRGPKSGFLIRVGSSRLQVCKEYPDLGIKELPCFVLNYKGTYKPTKKNKGFFNPVVEGEFMDNREKALGYCHNKNMLLRFSDGGWLVFAVADFMKDHRNYG